MPNSRTAGDSAYGVAYFADLKINFSVLNCNTAKRAHSESICSRFCFEKVLKNFTARLVQMRVLHQDFRTLSKYQLILVREQFRRNPPPHIMVLNTISGSNSLICACPDFTDLFLNI